MFKQDALEAEPIVDGVLKALLAWAPTRGRPGANLRAAVNYVRAYAPRLLQSDALGPPVLGCFEAAVATGINLQQMERVRAVAETYTPTLGRSHHDQGLSDSARHEHAGEYHHRYAIRELR